MIISSRTTGGMAGGISDAINTHNLTGRHTHTRIYTIYLFILFSFYHSTIIRSIFVVLLDFF